MNNSIRAYEPLKIMEVLSPLKKEKKEVDFEEIISSPDVIAQLNNRYLSWGNRISTEKTVELLKERDEGSLESQYKIIIGNIYLVLGIASNYCWKYDIKSCEIEIIHLGILGLIKATQKYNFSMKSSFPRYASSYIYRYIDNKIFLLNLYPYEKINILSKIEQNFVSIHDREPTVNELAKITHLEISEIEEIKSIFSPYPVTGEEFESKSYVIDPSPSVEEVIEKKLLKETLHLFLPGYISNPKALDVIIKRFGLDGKKPLLLQEIADLHGVSRERIRQIEKETLMRLKSNVKFRNQFYSFIA